MPAPISEQLAEKAKRRTAEEALEVLLKDGNAHSIEALMEAVSEKIGLREIAEIFAETLRNGRPDAKQRFVTLYLSMMERIARLQGELTQDDMTKITDQQLDALLKQGKFSLGGKDG